MPLVEALHPRCNYVRVYRIGWRQVVDLELAKVSVHSNQVYECADTWNRLKRVSSHWRKAQGQDAQGVGVGLEKAHQLVTWIKERVPVPCFVLYVHLQVDSIALVTRNCL